MSWLNIVSVNEGLYQGIMRKNDHNFTYRRKLSKINNIENKRFEAKIEPRHVISTMWYSDKCRLRRACASSF